MNLFDELKKNLADETLCAVATIVSGAANIGAKMLLYPDGRALGSLGEVALNAEVTRDAQRLMQL